MAALWSSSNLILSNAVVITGSVCVGEEARCSLPSSQRHPITGILFHTTVHGSLLPTLPGRSHYLTGTTEQMLMPIWQGRSL